MNKPWLIPLVALMGCVAGQASAEQCRVTVTDAYLGTDVTGAPGSLGVKARVKTFPTNRYLGALGGKAVVGATVKFQALFNDGSAVADLGSAVTDNGGWAQFDLASLYGKDSQGFYLKVARGGVSQVQRLRASQFVQVVGTVPSRPSACSADVLPDVYGSVYFRHPDDDAPILFSDFDDTLFNSTDVSDVIRTILSGHYELIDNMVVDATRAYRDAGGVFIGVTAQFSALRPFTKSELLGWGFDDAYVEAPYYYDGYGYNGKYLERSLVYVANNEYPDSVKATEYNRDHCAYKIEIMTKMLDEVFAGRWEDIVGIVGDTEDSDGCAAKGTGIHWYALMEGNDPIEDTSDPSGYTELRDGWLEALPVVCADAGLTCG